MKRMFIGASLATALSVLAFVPTGAQAAQFQTTGVAAETPAAAYAQIVIRERVRPGRRIVRERVIRRGGPRCRLVRSRIERPNGSVVFRTVQRCR